MVGRKEINNLPIRLNIYMRVTEILEEKVPQVSFDILQDVCSEFFVESKGLPLYKTLTAEYQDFQKVKVRHIKKEDLFSISLNEAFDSKRTQFSQRAIFASGNPPCIVDETTFYIFPTNGFNFLYNTAISEHHLPTLGTFASLCDQFGRTHGSKLISEILQFSYNPQHLAEGMQSGAEIILYGIPSYYAIRVTTLPKYRELLTLM